MLLSGEERILQSSGNHLCLNGFLAVLKSLTNVSIPVSIKYSKKWIQTCIFIILNCKAVINILYEWALILL